MADQHGEAWVPVRDWEVLYRRYFPRMRRYFARSVPDAFEAQDLAQQVFMELAKRKIPEEPLAYLDAIARHVLARYRRRKRAERAALAGYPRRLYQQ